MAEAQVTAFADALRASNAEVVSTPETPATPESPKPEAAVATPEKPEGSTPAVADPATPPAVADPAKPEAAAVDLNADDDPDALPAELAGNQFVQGLKVKADEAQLLRDALVVGYAVPTEDQEGKPLPLETIIKEMNAQRADAGALYDVINDRQDASALLGMLQTGYKPEVSERVYTQIVNFLASPQSNKFLQNYFTASGYKIVRADFKAPDGTTPEMADLNKKAENDRISRLEGELAKSQTAEQQRIQNDAAQKVAQQQDTVFKTFADKVGELAAKKGVDPSFVNDYIDAISKQVGGTPAVLQRIAKGNWVDVNKFFTKYHNDQLTRAQKYGVSVATTKTGIADKTPKTPQGGGQPAPGATPAKRTFRSSEDRVKQVTEMLRSGE